MSPAIFLTGLMTGLSLIVAQLAVRRKVRATDRLPFGVFLAVGLWMTWLYGPLGR